MWIWDNWFTWNVNITGKGMKSYYLPKTACSTLSMSSGVTWNGKPLQSSSCTLVRPSLKYPHHHLIKLSLKMSGPYTWHNWRCTSAGDCFWACRNLITAKYLAVGGRQYQYNHSHLMLCNNYCRHNTKTALYFSHVLPIYFYACKLPSD